VQVEDVDAPDLGLEQAGRDADAERERQPQQQVGRDACRPRQVPD